MIQMEPSNVSRKLKFLPVIGVFLLAGCEGGLTLPAMSQAPDQAGPTSETIQTDVAAPDAFNISETALWDGRPTFGGVWLAYPDVEQPERVRITNPANGRSVVGALYKRERDFPGPKIEMSADAAAALGVLAGMPTELTVVALRRKSVEIKVAPPADPLTPPDNLPTPIQRPSDTATVTQEAPVIAPAPTETPPVVATPLPDATPKPAPSQTGVAIYIQVATLQSKSRTDEVVRKLRRAGLDVEVREKQSGSKTLYRIIVGPADSVDAFKIMMGTVRQLGYKDAIRLG